MDPVTHALLGAAVGAAVHRQTGLRSAALSGLFAGLLPDADIFIRSDTDPLMGLELHRHFTHSIVFSPLIALIAALGAWLAARLFGRRLSLTYLMLPAWLGGLSHIFCDLWTSYGTLAGWPFSFHRFAWDMVSVIDPAITLPLLAGVVWSLIAVKRRPALISLALVAVYLSASLVQRHRASSALHRWLAEQNLTAERTSVKPTIGNILLWRGMASANGAFYAVALRCGLGDPTVLGHGEQAMFDSAKSAATAYDLPAYSVQSLDIARFYHFSDGWIGPREEANTIIADLRYATLPDQIQPLWGIRIDNSNPDTHTPFEHFPRLLSEDFRRFLEMLKGQAADENTRKP